MGQVSLFLPINSIVYWILLLEPFGSVCCIGTTPTFLWKKVCPVAMRTWCEGFTCLMFRVLDRRITPLFWFLSHLFTTLSINMAWFFTIVAQHFCLFSVLLVVVWGYCRHYRYCQFPIIFQTTEFYFSFEMGNYLVLCAIFQVS